MATCLAKMLLHDIPYFLPHKFHSPHVIFSNFDYLLQAVCSWRCGFELLSVDEIGILAFTEKKVVIYYSETLQRHEIKAIISSALKRLDLLNTKSSRFGSIVALMRSLFTISTLSPSFSFEESRLIVTFKFKK